MSSRPGTTAALMFFLGASALPATAWAQQAEHVEAASEHADNSGQDPTRPVTRFDVRLKYQDQPQGLDAETLTLRVDKPFVLGGGWSLSTRGDIPVIRNKAFTPQDPDGDHKVGLGDILTQALLIAPAHGASTIAFGTQLIVPIGSDDRFTTGKWQLVPTAAFIYQLPHISRGTFIGLIVRDAFSFAGKDDRADINVASVQPIFNWQLPDKWFLTISPEAKINTKDDWKLFLPLDATIGKKINPTTVISLQGDVGLIDDYRQYDWQLEFRVGFFF